MTKRKTLNFLKSFIIRNVISPKKGDFTKFWPREMKLAKELYQIIPDENFWQSMQMPYKVNSLAWFKTQKGEDLLKIKQKEFNFKPEEKAHTLEISDRKFGESYDNHKKPRFIRDFLN